MTRFAGSNLNKFFGSVPKFGEVGNAAHQIRSKEKALGFQQGGEMVGSGLQSFGSTYGNAMIAEAEGQLADAQGNAAMMEGIGGIAKSVMGGIGGAIGSGAGSAAGIGSIGANNYNFSSPMYSQAANNFASFAKPLI